MKTFLFTSLLGLSTFLACGEEEKETRTEPEGANPGECTDGADNDFDGDYDCNDSDCSGAPDCEEEAVEIDTGLETDSGSDSDTDTASDSDTGNNPNSTDDDGDGFSEDDGDCNDEDATIYASADDLTIDGTDQNCDGVDGIDGDEDGYVDTNAGGSDCNDNNASVYPFAGDIYGDGVDSDCDEMDCSAGLKDGVYFAACTEEVDRAAALNLCQSSGYEHLVTIVSVSEQQFVESLIPTTSIHYWMGLNKSSGSWLWDSGLSNSYTHWAVSQPDGDCANIDGPAGTWGDLGCGVNSGNGFVCEIR